MGRYYTYAVAVFYMQRGKAHPWGTDSIVARTAPEARTLYLRGHGSARHYNPKVFKVVVRRGPLARKGDR